MKNILLSVVIYVFVSCTHSIHLVHTNSFDQSQAVAAPKQIEAQSEQHVILWFVYDTGYVEEARELLQNQCLGGRIEGITTQFSTSHGFLSWRNKILMKGLCYSKPFEEI
jgi:hypothetical protein